MLASDESIPLNGVAVSALLVIFQRIGQGRGVASECKVVTGVWSQYQRTGHVETVKVTRQ